MEFSVLVSLCCEFAQIRSWCERVLGSRTSLGLLNPGLMETGALNLLSEDSAFRTSGTPANQFERLLASSFGRGMCLGDYRAAEIYASHASIHPDVIGGYQRIEAGFASGVQDHRTYRNVCEVSHARNPQIMGLRIRSVQPIEHADRMPGALRHRPTDRKGMILIRSADAS